MHALALLRPTAALRRLGARWAVVALLAAALMPAFARAMAPTGPVDWAAICQAVPQDSGSSQGNAHPLGDACVLCSLAHTTPVLTGATAPAVAVLAYAPPALPAAEPVRTGVPQTRAPSARAPPLSA